MSVFAVILLAVAVSIDGFGAGLACGIGRVKIPVLSIVLMGLAAGGAVLCSMLIGSLVGALLAPVLAKIIGGLLLIGFGLLMVWHLGKEEDKGGLLGLLNEPSQADADHSGSISAREAVILGLALALDGFGAGFGAALAGFSPLATGLAVAVTKILFVSSGCKLGYMASGTQIAQQIKVLPGLIIIGLGVLKIFLL